MFNAANPTAVSSNRSDAKISSSTLTPVGHDRIFNVVQNMRRMSDARRTTIIRAR